MTVDFEIFGQKFVGLNGGPEFSFSEAISFQVPCETQDDVDRYWSTLSEGGEEGPCGWLKDKYGVSWQIVPTALPQMLSDPDPARSSRVAKALGDMKKIIIADLESAAAVSE
jgi:predicted 3-demethylubiquinone-9 3-methyltransferase (glyoxalase superfamily)